MITAVNNDNNALAVATDSKGVQPLFCLISKQLLPSLESFLLSGQRKCGDWIQSEKSTKVIFDDADPMFININTLKELEQIEKSR
jgi:molybdopterin-guanine dinucleotide biosynthesis protein A